MLSLPHRRTLAIGTVTVLALIEGALAWPLFYSFVYSLVQGFDDEGYVVTISREWMAGGALYDEVYSQYGPFQVLVIGLPLRVLHLDLSLTAGRFITLVLYVATAALLAVLVYKLTRSLLSTILTQLLAFWAMSGVVLTPMHPIALLTFLIAALLVNIVVLRERWATASDWITGGVLASLVLTKVNVGIFVAVAFGYVLAYQWPADRVRRWLLPLAEVALIAIGPVLLMTQRSSVTRALMRLDTGDASRTLAYWSVAYAAAAISVVVFGRLARRNDVEREAPFAIGSIVAGGLVVGLATVIITLATGTSLRGLAEGTVVRPFGQSEALTALPAFSAEVLVLVIAVPALLVVGWLIGRAPPTPAWYAASGTVRTIGGLTLLIATMLSFQESLDVAFFAGSFAYIALVGLLVLPRIDGGSKQATGRLFLAAVSVTHTLQAFPVAGLHFAAAMLFPIVCAVVVLDDAVREYQSAVARAGYSFPPHAAFRLLTVAVLVWTLWHHVDSTRMWVEQYQLAVPLDLPESRWLRASPPEAEAIDDLLEAVEDCRELVTFPGYMSLNMWSGVPPPTGFNATLWPALLNDEEQQAVVDELEKAEDPVCFVRRIRMPYQTTDPGPLEQYLAGFEQRWENDDYRVFVRRRGPQDLTVSPR